MALAAPPANVCSYLRARRSLCLSGSHRFAQCQKLTRRAEHWELAVSQLLRKGRAIEMIHQNLHDRRAIEIRKLENIAYNPTMVSPLDDYHILAVRISIHAP